MFTTIVFCIPLLSSIAFAQGGMGYGGMGGGRGGMGGGRGGMGAMMNPKMFDALNLDDLYGMDFEDFLMTNLMRGGRTGGASGGYGSPYGFNMGNLFRGIGQMAQQYPGGMAKLYDDLNIDDMLERGMMFGGMGMGGGMGGGNMNGGMGAQPVTPFRFRR